MQPPIVYIAYPQGTPCPAPLRYALGRLIGQVVPESLAPWEGLTNFKELNDDYRTYERVCDWVAKEADQLDWFTIGGVVDAAELLVERALENGNLRACSETVEISFFYSSLPECKDWLDVGDTYDETHFFVPPASIDDFLADCAVTTFNREQLERGEAQTSEMNRATWDEWIAALYESGEMVEEEYN